MRPARQAADTCHGLTGIAVAHASTTCRRREGYVRSAMIPARPLALCILLAGCVAPAPHAELARSAWSSHDRRYAPPAHRAPISATRLARRVHERTNDERRRHGLPALAWSGAFERVGGAHSRDLARTRRFAHRGSDGSDVNARGQRAGLACEVRLSARRTRVGFSENLFRITLYRRVVETRTAYEVRREVDWYDDDEMAREIVRGWLGSPGHRRNLLDPVARSAGVGVAIGGDDAYVTQVLC